MLQVMLIFIGIVSFTSYPLLLYNLSRERRYQVFFFHFFFGLHFQFQVKKKKKKTYQNKALKIPCCRHVNNNFIFKYDYKFFCFNISCCLISCFLFIFFSFMIQMYCDKISAYTMLFFF